MKKLVALFLMISMACFLTIGSTGCGPKKAEAPKPAPTPGKTDDKTPPVDPKAKPAEEPKKPA